MKYGGEKTVAFMQNLKAQLIKTGMAKEEDIKGLDDKTIDYLEMTMMLGCVFPPSYKEFFRVFGRGAGWFFQGTDIFYPAFLNNKDAVLALFPEGTPLEDLQNEKFHVFAAHQGYLFWYFDCWHGVDTVYCLQEDCGDDDNWPWTCNHYFEDFLEESFAEQLAALQGAL